MSQNNPLHLDKTAVVLLFQKAKNLIADGNTGEAIELMLGYDEIIDPENTFILFSQRWESLEDKILSGMLTNEQQAVNKTKIAHDLLLSMKTIKADFLKKIDKTTIRPAPLAAAKFQKETGRTHVLWLFAQEDAAEKIKLKKYLFLLLRNPKIKFLDIYQHVPDNISNKEDYQKQMIQSADTVLCIVTENILTLPAYEWAEIAAQQEKLVPIRMREIDTVNTIFKKDTKGLPADGTFVSQHEKPSAVLSDIARTFTGFLQNNFQI